MRAFGKFAGAMVGVFVELAAKALIANSAAATKVFTAISVVSDISLALPFRNTGNSVSLRWMSLLACSSGASA